MTWFSTINKGGGQAYRFCKLNFRVASDITRETVDWYTFKYVPKLKKLEKPAIVFLGLNLAEVGHFLESIIHLSPLGAASSLGAFIASKYAYILYENRKILSQIMKDKDAKQFFFDSLKQFFKIAKKESKEFVRQGTKNTAAKYADKEFTLKSIEQAVHAAIEKVKPFLKTMNHGAKP